MPALSTYLRLLDWQLPLTCITVILLSNLYTYHNYYHLLRESSHLMQDLASMQIMGVILASAAMSAVKTATSAKGRPLNQFYSTHPMLPSAAARRRQMMPLV